MNKTKVRCPICKEWFISANGNGKYCNNCRPGKKKTNIKKKED
jgi:hypothetical protein